MKVRKVGTVTLGAAVTAAFASLLVGQGTANAACASFWGLGGGAQCSSTFGNTAIALGTTDTAHAVGGFGNTALSSGAYAQAVASGGAFNTAIALGDRATAASAGFASTSLAVGKNTTAIAAGVGSLAADIGDNSTPYSGTARGLGLVQPGDQHRWRQHRARRQRRHPGAGPGGTEHRHRWQLGDQRRQGQLRPGSWRSAQRCVQHR